MPDRVDELARENEARPAAYAVTSCQRQLCIGQLCVCRADALRMMFPGLLTRTFSHREIWPPELGCHADEWLAVHGTPLAGATLLHMCVDYGELDIARWLLDRGTDVDSRAVVDRDGFGGHTALFNAVVSYYYYVKSKYAKPKPDRDPFAQLLLDRGANPNVRASLRTRVHDETMHDYRNVTPLEWGEQFHAKELVSIPALRLIAERVGRA